MSLTISTAAAVVEVAANVALDRAVVGLIARSRGNGGCGMRDRQWRRVLVEEATTSA